MCQGRLTVSACNTIGYLACRDTRGTARAKTLVGDKLRWNGFERENSCRDFLFDVPFSPFSPFSTWHTISFNKELLKTGVKLYMPACLQTEELSCSTDLYHSCLQTICHSWDAQLHCQHRQDSLLLVNGPYLHVNIQSWNICLCFKCWWDQAFKAFFTWFAWRRKLSKQRLHKYLRWWR